MIGLIIRDTPIMIAVRDHSDSKNELVTGI